MRSMTGYGRGRSVWRGLGISVELSSVNRKQNDVVVTMPRELVELEPRLRELVNERVARGRVTVVVACRAARSGPPPLGVDAPLAKAYHAAMVKLQRELGVPGVIGIETVLRAPGVVRAPEEQLAAALVRPHVEAALAAALAGLLRMRRREGAHLARDMKRRCGLLHRHLRRIARLHPAMARRQRAQLAARIRASGLTAVGDDSRLSRELLLFADRSDVSEELTRVASHLAQFEAHLDRDEPVGRMLDFLAQEIGRELNTLSAKSADADIAQRVVACKSELERIREQVQNVE